MRLEVSFKIVNSEFNKAYAEEYKEGEESPDNMKYHQATKFKIENVRSITKIKEASIEVSGVDSSDVEHKFIIEDMFHLKCDLDNGTVEDYYVSNKLIRNTHATTKGNVSRFYYYLLDEFSFGVLCSTCYVYPESLPASMNDIEWKQIRLPNEVKSEVMERVFRM